jgi:hypothetical protein
VSTTSDESQYSLKKITSLACISKLRKTITLKKHALNEKNELATESIPSIPLNKSSNCETHMHSSEAKDIETKNADINKDVFIFIFILMNLI